MSVGRTRALIAAPLARVWDFVIEPGNMHLWGPLIEPVTGFGRPLQTRQAFRSLAAILEGQVAGHPPDREPG